MAISKMVVWFPVFSSFTNRWPMTRSIWLGLGFDSDSDLTRSTDELANNQESCCVVTVYFSEVKTNLARVSHHTWPTFISNRCVTFVRSYPALGLYSIDDRENLHLKSALSHVLPKCECSSFCHQLLGRLNGYNNRHLSSTGTITFCFQKQLLKC